MEHFDRGNNNGFSARVSPKKMLTLIMIMMKIVEHM